MRGWLLVSVLLLGGCTQPVVEEPEPVDVAALVTRLDTLHQSIKDQFTGEEAVDAHEQLHEVGNILSKLSEIDDTTPLSVEVRTEIHNAAQDMLAAYSDVDGALHKGEEPDYESVAERLDEDMQRLKAAVQPASPSPTETLEADTP